MVLPVPVTMRPTLASSCTVTFVPGCWAVPSCVGMIRRRTRPTFAKATAGKAGKIVFFMVGRLFFVILAESVHSTREVAIGLENVQKSVSNLPRYIF